MEIGNMRMKKNKKKAKVKKDSKPKKSFSLGQKPKKTMDYGGELFKVENWLPD